ncbi:MAG: hypothetical protein WC725_04885 [Patescibacteria group bacterium]|jgi:hypothetical protein
MSIKILDASRILSAYQAFKTEDRLHIERGYYEYIDTDWDKHGFCHLQTLINANRLSFANKYKETENVEILTIAKYEALISKWNSEKTTPEQALMTLKCLFYNIELEYLPPLPLYENALKQLDYTIKDLTEHILKKNPAYLAAKWG